MRRDEFLASVRDRQAWIDLVWVVAMLAVGFLILLGLELAGAPDSTFITMIGMLPLGILAFVRTRQHGQSQEPAFSVPVGDLRPPEGRS